MAVGLVRPFARVSAKPMQLLARRNARLCTLIRASENGTGHRGNQHRPSLAQVVVWKGKASDIR